MEKFDVVIIGGGAAGLACAVTLKKSNKNISVCIVEAGDRLGKKLASTGNGQGNVTNLNMTKDKYFGGNVALVEKLCCNEKAFKTEENLFHMLLLADEVGRVYPSGKQASSLVDSLILDIKKYGVEVKLSTKIIDIDSGFVLKTSENAKMSAKYVVTCVGGKAQKQFKTDGSSYALAQKFGHTLTPLYPSLVQLKTDMQHIKTLKGIRCDCSVSALYNGVELAKKRGDVIFTEYGVSGNAIFSLTPYIVDKEGVVISLEFLPDVSQDRIKQDIDGKKQCGYEESELLSGTLHNQLGRAILKRCGSSNSDKIAKLVKNFTLPVTGNLGFDHAQVTKGGVKMNEVSEDLESKLAEGLFFAGEMLDVDGECGGYNLHWAFTSGIFVAENILKRV